MRGISLKPMAELGIGYYWPREWRFFPLVDLSHPIKESRDLTDHAADPHPKHATGLSSMKAMYLR